MRVAVRSLTLVTCVVLLPTVALTTLLRDLPFVGRSRLRRTQDPIPICGCRVGRMDQPDVRSEAR